jgi:tetratricopeptide (TPR) repeat protein
MDARGVVQRGSAFALIAGAAAAGSLALPSQGRAGPIAKCDGRSSPPEAVIAACTAALRDSRLELSDRADFLLVRGQAEESLDESPQAVADFGQIIEFEKQAQTAELESKLGDDMALAAGRGMASGAGLTGPSRDFVRFRSDLVTAYAERAGSYAELGNAVAARADADRAVQLGPSFSWTWNARCWARAVVNNELDAALADCNHALELVQSKLDRAGILDSRALVRYRQGQFDLSAADEDDAIAASPKMPSFRFLRGLAEERLGKTAEGRADIAAALAAKPNLADQYARWGLRPE